MKQYFTLMCLVRSELLPRPFVSSRIALILSRCRSDASISYPSCSCTKYRAHKMVSQRVVSTPTSAASVELFCIDLVLPRIAHCHSPRPKLIPTPVCHRQSSWTAYAASTHHLERVKQSASGFNGMFRVPFMYPISLLTFPHSYSSGHRTLVVRNAIAGWLSRCTPALRNSSWTVMGFASDSSLTVKKVVCCRACPDGCDFLQEIMMMMFSIYWFSKRLYLLKYVLLV